MSEWVDVADAGSLAVGRSRTVEAGGRRYALVHTADGFYAVDDACPHRGGALGAGIVEQGTLHCPLHGWGFDVRTGACDIRPDKPVRTHAVRVEEGRIWIRIA